MTTELAPRPLVHASTRAAAQLQKSGADLLTRTREASTLLGMETRDAGRTWWASTRAASADFVASVRAELEQLVKSVRDEAELPELPAAPLQGESLEQARARVQLELLVRLKRALGTLDGRLQERLDALESAPAIETKAPKAPKAPLSGYDEMTAKEVVAALADLSEKKRAAVAAYEKANKGRRTVLRAAKRAA